MMNNVPNINFGQGLGVTLRKRPVCVGHRRVLTRHMEVKMFIKLLKSLQVRQPTFLGLQRLSFLLVVAPHLLQLNFLSFFFGLSPHFFAIGAPHSFKTIYILIIAY